MGRAESQATMESHAAIGLGALDDLIGYHLRRADNVFSADFARVLEGRGVRQVPFGILSIVATNPGIHQGGVGRSLGIQRANMVALINELVEAGLLERRVAPEDRRAFALFLTEKGAATYQECRARLIQHESDLLVGLSDVERQILITLLRRLAV